MTVVWCNDRRRWWRSSHSCGFPSDSYCHSCAWSSGFWHPQRHFDPSSEFWVCLWSSRGPRQLLWRKTERVFSLCALIARCLTLCSWQSHWIAWCPLPPTASVAWRRSCRRSWLCDWHGTGREMQPRWNPYWKRESWSFAPKVPPVGSISFCDSALCLLSYPSTLCRWP